MKKSLRSDPIKRENKVGCTMRDNSTGSNAKPSLKSENEEETARAVPLEEFNQWPTPHPERWLPHRRIKNCLYSLV